jgi:hypothetical protein
VKEKKIREDFFKKFIKLSCEEKMDWALNTGYEWFSLLPKKKKLFVKYFRNGGKDNKII